ncbi:MAG TPA: hypothetical protein VJV79_28875, partial [Polyangiaceae bacterium]|nr:hypothetical protein [Polyangiaceae bacterium]
SSDRVSGHFGLPSDRVSGHFGLPSEPPTSGSQYSNSRTGSTPRPQTLDRSHARKTGLLPIIAAIGGLAAAISAIFWASHRPGPTPLITTRLERTTHRSASNGAPRDDNSPVGVNIDSLPTAVGAIPNAPDPSNALPGRKLPGSALAAPSVATNSGRATKDLGRDPDEVENPYKSRDPTPASVPVTTTATTATTPATAVVPMDQRSPLNRGAALAALGSAASAAAACKRADGPHGPGSASVTFSPDGPVKSVSVSPPFAGTAVGQCVISAFRGAHVPPFSGSSITLPKSFRIPE